MAKVDYLSVNEPLRLSIVMMAVLTLGYSQPSYAESQQGEPTLKEVIEKPDEKAVAKEGEQIAQSPAKQLGPVDKLDRGVPRTAVGGFFGAIKKNDYETAAEYLDLRNMPRGYSQSDGPEFARQLKIVLDRALWVDMDILSTDPKGHSDDGLPSYRDFVGRINLNDDKVDVLLQRVPRGDGVYIWKFSSETVRQIPQFYREYGYGKLGEKLYLSLPEYRFLTLQTWQWVLLFGIVIVAYVIAFIPTYLFGWFLRRKGTSQSKLWARFVTGPLRWLIVVGIAYHWIDIIHPSIETRALLRAKTILTLIIVWLTLLIVDIYKGHWAEKLRRNGKEHAIVLLRPAATAVKIIIVIIGVLVWLDNIGYKVSTLLAGLGIGGIAIALAAQKSLENLIGAATLYMATPVRVGDFCRYGDKLGTVEEIGLRSTRIRTLDRTVVSVPNGEFAAMPLENFAEREKIRFNPKLHLRYGTTPKQLSEIITAIEKLLNENSMIDEEPNIARFMGFGTYSLEINVLAFIMTTDYLEYLEIAEELNIRILEIIEAAGAELATPVQALHKT